MVVGGRRSAAGHGRKFVALDEWLVLDNSSVDNAVMCVYDFLESLEVW